ncbi:RanBP1 domain containing protein [Coccidioides immitis RMSCC 2394]|uniref:RanBP1 domain containing protein n=1 Tax=Coccidioides immitis RMSCC 2394 TaxID=404692 RepID=A0A0J6XZB0_COCIT|nr:RanBP1 domain containing protein [Coccidioides immitis RMSCC 2394]
MSKRGAEIQGSKETGLDTMSMNAEAPQRATAAQLAKRKIKPLGQRRGRVGSPNIAPSTQSSPFSTIDPNIVPSSTPSATTNGFSFQSQSFSQGNSQNTQPQPFGDQNSSFSFFGSQSNSAPSSFSFSASTPNQQITNPFNNTSSNQNSNFQGFKGNMFNIPATTGEDGQSGTSTTSGFGVSGFGTQQGQPPSFSFGGNGQTPNPPFAASTAATSNIFGQPSGTSIFPTSQPFGAAPATQGNKAADQMQMSPDGKPALGASKSNIFNFSAPAQPAFTSATTTTPSFAFGSPFTQTSTPTTSASKTTDAPTSTWNFSAPTSASTSLFGSSTKPDDSSKTISSTESNGISAPAAFKGGSLFGSATKPDESALEAGTTAASSTPAVSSTTQSIFSTPSLGSTSTTSNIFGNLKESKDQTEESKKDAAPTAPPKFQFGNSLFGTTTKPTEMGSLTPSSAPASSVFSSTPGKPLFGESKTETSAPESSSSPATASTLASFTPSTAAPTLLSASTNGSSLFSGVSQPEQSVSTTTSDKDVAPTSSLFAASAPAPGSALFPRSTTSSNLFGISSKGSEPAPPTPSASIFGASTTTPSSKTTFGAGFSWGGPQPSTTEPSKPLFTSDQSKPDSQPPPTTVAKAFEKPAAEKPSLFSIEKPAEKAFGPTDSIFKPVDAAQPPASVSKALFQPSTPTGPAQPQAMKTVATDAGTMVAKPAYADSGMQTQYDVESEVAQLMPPEDAIPSELSESEKKDWINKWRFQYINQSFKEQIASIDASCNDFEPLIAYYVMLRRQIGYPCSLVSHYRAVPYGSRRTFPAGEPIPPQEEQQSKKRKAVDGEVSNAKRGKPEATELSPSTSPTKRKVRDENGADVCSGQVEKYTKMDEDSNIPEVNGETSIEGDEDQGEASETLRMFISSYVAAQGRQRSPQPIDIEETGGKEKVSKFTSDGLVGDLSKDTVSSGASAASPGATNGRSLFDRVELGPNGQPRRQVDDKAEGNNDSVTAEKPADPIASLFSGSKFASSFDSPGSVTPQFSFASASNTRTPSPSNPKIDGETPKASPPSSIFASSTSIPKFSFGAVSESATPKAAPPSNGVSTPNLSTLFGSSTSKPLFPPMSAEPEKQSSSAMLSPAPFSANTSVEPSRSTTPAVSDEGTGEPTDDTANLPQVDFTKGGAGETDEDVKFEVRARALKLVPGSTWQRKGVGLLRVLKNRETGRARILLRADPSGNVILNSSLIPQVDYLQRATSVQFLVPTGKEAEQWALKVKEATKASELAAVMEECKKKD